MKNASKFLPFSKFIPIMICLLLAYLFVLLCSTTTSPLYLSNPYWHHGDSGIFQEMGLVIAHGGVPYVDVFDHKGPVLFFIQALGLLINEYWGIFVLQGLSLFVTLWCWYKIITVFQKNIWFVWGIIIIALIFLFGYYQRGNMCEEWSLPYISISIYLFLKHLPDKMRLSCREWFFVGILTCTVIFIRANNIAPVLGFAIFSIVADMRADKKLVVQNILYGLLGCVVVAGFWILLFYFVYGQDALSWMIYATFLYNIDYIKDGVDIGILNTLIYYVSITCFILVSITNLSKENKSITYSLLLSYAITIFAIGSNKLTHYLIIFIPLFVVSMTIIHSVRWFHTLLVCGSLVQAIDTGKSGLDVLVVRIFKDIPTRASHEDFTRFVSAIPYTERNDIYNLYALPTFYFAEEKIVHRNRCVMETHAQHSSRLQQKEKEDGLIAKSPTWVLTSMDYTQLDSVDYAFIQTDYILMDSVVGYDDCGFVYCYKKRYSDDNK